MNDVAKYLGRGLLVLALSGAVFACGDDDDNGDESPDGGEAGTGGDEGGTGGDEGGTGGGGTGGTDAGPSVTPEECEEDAVQASGPECLECVCEAGPEETVACSADCWSLVSCVGSRCGGDGSDIPCITSMCSAFLGGDAPAEAMAFGPVIRMCTDVCQSPVTDGGADPDAGQ